MLSGNPGTLTFHNMRLLENRQDPDISMLQADDLSECYINTPIICNKPEVCCATCNFVSLSALCFDRSSSHIMALMEWPATSEYSIKQKIITTILLRGGLVLLIFLTFISGTLELLQISSSPGCLRTRRCPCSGSTENRCDTYLF